MVYSCLLTGNYTPQGTGQEQKSPGGVPGLFNYLVDLLITCIYHRPYMIGSGPLKL
jgi:hypothetical protein